MKKLWLIRKDEEAVSPVIATILMVAITVVLAAVLYVMVSGLLGGGGGGAAKSVGFSPASAGNNWTLTVASVSASGISYATTTFKIYDTNGAPVSTNLLSVIMGSPTTGQCTNWAVKKVCYVPTGSGQVEVKVGDRLLAEKTTYLASYRWELLDASSILANGVFS